MRLPHPIPYQGSKRRLADRILVTVSGRRVETLYEPFAGSAAISLAACSRRLADSYVIADSLGPLVGIWNRVLHQPQQLADDYERIWTDQLVGGKAHFLRVRDEFNEDGEPAKLLYLLARCVKNSPRFNGQGHFNQSADHRRKGMNPTKMRREIHGASHLLAARATTVCGDFENVLEAARPTDLVYLDPPWEGTSAGVDKRYHEWLPRERLIAALGRLNERGVPWVLSYDGRHGAKEYGAPLPEELNALRLELHAGRSSQATLNGKAAMTVESLYLSEQLADGAGVLDQPSLFEAA